MGLSEKGEEMDRWMDGWIGQTDRQSPRNNDVQIGVNKPV